MSCEIVFKCSDLKVKLAQACGGRRPVVPGVSEVYYLQSFRLSPALSVWTFSLAPMAPSTVPRPGRAYSTTRNKVES